MSGYVECCVCGKHLHLGDRAFKLDGEWYCKECGLESLWDNDAEPIWQEDIQEAEEARAEQAHGDYVDQCFEQERNRRYGIDV